MSDYIHKCLKELGWENVKPLSTPIDCAIDANAPAVSPEIKHMAMKAIGMIGWLSVTCRCDITYAHSRISQYILRKDNAIDIEAAFLQSVLSDVLENQAESLYGEASAPVVYMLQQEADA